MRISPAYQLDRYNCPHCDSLTSMHWISLGEISSDKAIIPETAKAAKNIDIAICSYCKKDQVWFQKALIYPNGSKLIPDPNPDMPITVSRLYHEARSIYSKSPRASAAVLRLAIEQLCSHLGCKQKSLSYKISELAKAGLHESTIKSLEIVRVVGNHAVHPGLISFDDDSNISAVLFDLLNEVVEETISREKRIQSYFEKLPLSEQEKIRQKHGIGGENGT